MQTGPRNNARFTLVVTALVLLGAIPMLLVIALSGAPSILLLATTLAAIPVPFLVASFLWLDRYEPEPRSLLVGGLAWGCFAATAGALVLQGIGGYFGGLSDAQSLAWAAPVTEEATKGFYLLLLLWWRRHELDGILDGVVYAGMVGIGFAFAENILYLAAAYNGTDGLGPGGTEALTATFVMRCLVSPFAHPMFTAFIGIGVGVATSTRSTWLRWAAPPLGYLLAVAAHAAWNGSTLYGASGFLQTYVFVMVPAFVVLIAFATWQRRSEKKMLVRALDDAARRGLLPPGDILWLASLQGRRTSRSFAREQLGQAGEAAMREYHQVAIELGFLHHRYLRGTAPRDAVARGNHFVTRMNDLRPGLVFPYPLAPQQSGQAVRTP